MITYKTIIFACWVIFLLVWAISAFNVKPDVREARGRIWRPFWLAALVGAISLGVVAVRAAKGTAHVTHFGLPFAHGIFRESTGRGWAAAALSVLGVSIAVWARAHLGRNWSAQPAVKVHHELVTTGPYAYVRHPIYTGLTLMALGNALTGSIRGICVFLVAGLLFVSRIGREERIMLNLFPEAYPAYQVRTKKLIPWVW